MPKNPIDNSKDSTVNRRMTDDDIQREVLAEIRSAEETRGTQSAKRQDAWDRYYGRKLGNERKGRSQFITRDIMDTVEWMMPFLMKTFASGDPKIHIEIKGQPAHVGKALMDNIQLTLANGTPTIYFLFYQWFKDALVSNTSFVKMGYHFDQKVVTVDFDDLSGQNLLQLLSDPDMKVQKIEQVGGPFMMPTYRATARVKKTIEDKVFAENTPPWEFIVSSKARDMNDEYGKGHCTEVTLDYLKRISRSRTEDKKKPYFKNLNELQAPGGKATHVDTLSGERANYMGEDEPIEDFTESEVGAKLPVKLKEWYTRLDVDGDGFLEDIVVWLGNEKLIRWEINEEEFIPFSAIRPIIDCYKFHGIAWAELLVEIQNLKTMLFRRILDMFDFQVQGRWRVDPDGSVDLYALYNHTPGGSVSAKKDAIENLYTTPFDPNNFRILEYVDSIKENRTGVSRYNQGMDAESLNKTATGIVQIQSAAMQRMELVARIFAEGLRDFYQKIVFLYQQYMTRPFTAKVHGDEVQITPEMIQGKVICTVNMGVQASVGMEEAVKIERMLGVLFKVNQLYPGLLNPQKVHNLCRRYVTSLGFKQVDDFITDLKTYLGEIKKFEAGQAQAQKMQQDMIQMQQQIAQLEAAVKKQDADTKAKKVELDAELEAKKLAQDFIIDQEEIEQDERDSIRDFKVDMMGILASPKGEGEQRNDRSR